MKRTKFLAALAVVAAPFLCAAETWTSVPMVDVACAAKAKANPDAHTRECAVACVKSGFGIVTPAGDFLKFDAKGNEQAAAALQANQRNDHLRVTVTGELVGGTIQVQSLKM